MNLSRSISSSNSARRLPTSCRRNAISVSSALSTERRIDSNTLRSARYVEQTVSRLAMERSGLRTGIHMAVPFLWLSGCADGDPEIISVGLMRRMGSVPPRGDRGRKTVTLS